MTANGGYFQQGGSSGTTTIAAKITGIGSVGINFDGPGTVILANSANNYAGDTRIGTQGPAYWVGGGAAATLVLGANNAIPYGGGAGNVVVGYAYSGPYRSMLDINGYSANINGLTTSLTGSQALYAVVDNLSTTPGTLTVGNNYASSTFDGVIQNTAGNLGLTKSGTGILALAGPNSYSGGTVVASGSVFTGGTGFGSGGVSLAAGTSVNVNANSGLTGFYYLSSSSIQAAANAITPPLYFNSLSSLQTHLAALTPSVIAQSNSVAGNAFSMDFNGEASGFPAAVQSNNQFFEALYTGGIHITSSGSYTFGLNSDDGSMIFIDGKTVVNDNAFQGESGSPPQQTGAITLSAGYHQIAIGYYQGNGPYGLQAYYQGPDSGERHGVHPQFRAHARPCRRLAARVRQPSTDRGQSRHRLRQYQPDL